MKLSPEPEYWKMRLWQLKLEVHRPVPGLPLPMMIVEEEQNHRSYRMVGRYRHDPGGQLQITLSGTGGVYMGEKHFRLTRGMAFLHNHRDPDFGYYYPPESGEPWRFLWISTMGTDELFAEFNRRYGTLFELPLDRGIIPMLAAYEHMDSHVEILEPFQAAQLVYKVLALLAECSEAGGEENPRSRLITRAQELILRNLHENQPIRLLADELEISREHLSRLFHAQTGMTIHEYAIRCKLEIAMNLIYQHRLSCKEIAEQAGFSQYSAFARAVRKHTGKSPEALREASDQ